MRVACIQRGVAGLKQFIGAGVGGNGGRACSGIFHDERLAFVGCDGARESQIVAGAIRGQFAHFEIERASRGEDVIFKVIA